MLKLSRLSLRQRKFDSHGLKRLYLVSGDVVAFYPNVNTALAHLFARERYMHWISQQDISDEEFDAVRCAAFVKLFEECLRAADDDLICGFQGQYWKQSRGLAMGVASSPDLANLYGAHFEERCDALRNPDVLFYGRYIDDCLALVYAFSEESAMALMRDNVIFENCTIEWSVSDNYCNFLDMTLFFVDGGLQHKPFRKPMNHFERIPFVSWHPLYVKRGTFVGELSRLATLSSRYDDFAAACREAVDIYTARGYPVELLKAWLRDNYLARWEKRLENRVHQHAADVLVLKSEYNTSWDYFNVQKLEEQIKEKWAEAFRHLAFGNRELLDSMSPEIREVKFSSITLAGVNSSALHVGGDGIPVDTHEDKIAIGLHGRFLRLDKLSLFNRRFLVSKKRTKQLYDLASMWRKSVLSRRDRHVFDDDEEVPQLHLRQRTLDSWLNAFDAGRL